MRVRVPSLLQLAFNEMSNNSLNDLPADGVIIDYPKHLFSDGYIHIDLGKTYLKYFTELVHRNNNEYTKCCLSISPGTGTWKLHIKKIWQERK